jgi:DNA processing protein
VFWKLLMQNRDCVRSALSDAARLNKLKYPAHRLYQEEHAMHAIGARWLLYTDPEYPESLKDLPDAPPLLVAHGNLQLLQRKMVSIVGSRGCSAIGAAFTERICKGLSADMVVVSGFARGIDTAAHAASVERGTIAILAGGVDNIYPEENAELYKRVLDCGGLMLSESQMGAPPLPQAFHNRNRLIAGISKAIVVVEAMLKSGSLMTARLASEYNREVFAVPGHPMDPRSEGVNYLIKNGANMLCEPSDLREVYDDLTAQGLDVAPEQGSELCERGGLFDAISHTPITQEQLAEFLDQDIAQIKAGVVQLELDGLVRVLPDGSVVRTK